MTRLLPCAGLVVAALLSGTCIADASQPDRQRGVSWVAGAEVEPADFEALALHHVNWIVQTPFGWQRGHDSTEIGLVTDGRIYWGERDAGLLETARLARQQGIRTLLKPHIWLSRAADGKWRSDIAMADDAAWAEWFSSYRTFILHYARLAEEMGAGGFSVGTELRETVRHDPGAWRRLIADVREVYSGKLTYAANWYREFEEVPFWDDLDYIGVQAYFPLSDSREPTLEQLVEGWAPHLEAIRRVQKEFGKPVLFTELGYRSSADAAIEPWKWPAQRPDTGAAGDEGTQVRAFRAFFETFWDEPWFAGAYVWKWYPTSGGRTDGPLGFSPQGKAAERTLADWYGRNPGAG